MVTKSRRIFEPYRGAVPCRGGRQRRRMIAASPTLRPPDARLSDRYHAGDRQDRHETGRGVRGITLPQQEALKTASDALWSSSGIAPGHVLAQALDGSNDTRNGLIALVEHTGVVQKHTRQHAASQACLDAPYPVKYSPGLSSGYGGMAAPQ